MRKLLLAVSAALLLMAPVLANASDPSAAQPSVSATASASVASRFAPYDELMQEIARRADPLDTADLQQIERRAQAGSREDQLAMGCLLSLGTAAQVTSPQVPAANPPKAAEYFEMAARKGSPEAQFLLGIMNLRGNGVPTDRVKGAMWIDLASAAKLKPAVKEARRLKDQLSRNELSEAQRRAAQWQSEHSGETISMGSAE